MLFSSKRPQRRRVLRRKEVNSRKLLEEEKQATKHRDRETISKYEPLKD